MPNCQGIFRSHLHCTREPECISANVSNTKVSKFFDENYTLSNLHRKFAVSRNVSCLTECVRSRSQDSDNSELRLMYHKLSLNESKIPIFHRYERPGYPASFQVCRM